MLVANTKLTPVMTRVFRLAEKGKDKEAIDLMKEHKVAGPELELEGIKEFIEHMERHAQKAAMQNRRY